VSKRYRYLSQDNAHRVWDSGPDHYDYEKLVEFLDAFNEQDDRIKELERLVERLDEKVRELDRVVDYLKDET
jgi:hypothetical protein